MSKILNSKDISKNLIAQVICLFPLNPMMGYNFLATKDLLQYLK